MRLLTRFTLATFAVALLGSQAMAQKDPKPPKPPKSDNHGPKSNGSELAGGGADSWILMVPEVCEALAAGRLKNLNGDPVSLEAQAELLAFVGSDDATMACPEKQSRSAAYRTPMTAAGETSRDAVASRANVLRKLTAAGAPSKEAAALLDAIAGILSTPKKGQLLRSVDRSNDLVRAAPPSFFATAPPEFLAIHGVLERLLRIDKSD